MSRRALKLLADAPRGSSVSVRFLVVAGEYLFRIWANFCSSKLHLPSCVADTMVGDVCALFVYFNIGVCIVMYNVNHKLKLYFTGNNSQNSSQKKLRVVFQQV